jgi:hypothetical protein
MYISLLSSDAGTVGTVLSLNVVDVHLVTKSVYALQNDTLQRMARRPIKLHPLLPVAGGVDLSQESAKMGYSITRFHMML